MNTTRRGFLCSTAALAALATVNPASVLTAAPPAAPAERTIDGWAWHVWQGDIDAVLNFGNSGQNPLWGDDFKVNPDQMTVEFLSFQPDGVYRAIAKPGDVIARDPNGVFHVFEHNRIWEMLKSYERAIERHQT
jgi:hypothetical protein